MKKWTRRSVVALSALAGLPALRAVAAEGKPVAPSLHACRLPLFDLLAYVDKPDLGKLGIQPIRIYTAASLWGKGEDVAKLPRTASVQQAFARESSSNESPIVLDIEHWPFRGNGVPGTVARMLDLLQMVRAQLPRAKIGFYGVSPLRDYWRAIRPRESGEHVEWMRENDRFRAVAEAADIGFPSLYTFYDDVPGWRAYAAANLEEARRLAPGKPLYAFIWPQYHNSNKLLGGKLLAASYWRTQLEDVSSRADGAVLWGGWSNDSKRMRWDESAPWWTETRRYLAARNQNPSC